jgi:hypothetical protein
MMRGMSPAEIDLVEDIMHRMKIRLIEMNGEMKRGAEASRELETLDEDLV